MAKKSILERERKKRQSVLTYMIKRSNLMNRYKKMKDFKLKLKLHEQIQKLPRNSAKVRLSNRCWKTGRSRGVFRNFGLARQAFRELAHQGLLPGITKSSW